jgi:hypothetical protein
MPVIKNTGAFIIVNFKGRLSPSLFMAVASGPTVAEKAIADSLSFNQSSRP